MEQCLSFENKILDTRFAGVGIEFYSRPEYQKSQVSERIIAPVKKAEGTLTHSTTSDIT
ncbi:MAG: hypothetical protein ACI8RD_005651 [Bacillariaceae sp.]|jgi:hypothetical protein